MCLFIRCGTVSIARACSNGHMFFPMSEVQDLSCFDTAPVTHILPPDLHAQTIICAGEVEDELLHAFRNVPEKPLHSRQYRCYRLWKYPSFTLILSGIGSGCVEPLLWEILSPGLIRQIVLIGTAGCVRPAAPALGRALPIHAAWSCGTGIDGEHGLEPLTPRWPLPEGSATCSIASSDFFYGYSDRVLDGRFAACQGPFRERYLKVRDLADLIDMEVAQFYYFAPRFDRTGSLSYLAIKGSSNLIGLGEQMNHYAAGVMDDCAAQAFSLMGLFVDSPAPAKV